MRHDKTDKPDAGDFINDGLKRVFEDLSEDDLPPQILDLLTALKAQDASRDTEDD